MMTFNVVGSALLMSCLLGTTILAAEVVNCPKVLPDRAVDTSSLKAIVKGVVKPDMSEQDKFLALYNFYRRMVYHHRYMGRDRRAILKVINSYGCLLCGSQAGSFSMLLRDAGFHTRVAHAKAEGYGGHTAAEVKYNDKWHGFDTMTAFWVLNRDGEIASFAELKADATLIRDAVKEKRAPKEWNLCSLEIEEEQKGIEKVISKDRPWTLLRWKPGMTVTGFWTIAVNEHRTQDGTYGGSVQPGVLDIKLKPNEEYVRLWDNVGLWLKSPSFDKVGPYHSCGHIDELDTVNFKYFEPYKKTDMPYCRYAYRYYGNGWLEWKPDAKKGELKAFAAKPKNLEPDAESGMFKPVNGQAPASLTVPLKSPYALVRVEIDLLLEQPDEATTSVSIGPASVRRGRRRAKFTKVWNKQGKASGLQKIVYTNTRNPIYLYDIKVDAKGSDVKFHIARIKSIFQLNWASLPSLYPGDNTITVSAKAEQELKEHKLLVTTEWADGKDWKKDRTDTQTVTKLPYTYELKADVPSDKMPKMKRMVMKLEAR